MNPLRFIILVVVVTVVTCTVYWYWSTRNRRRAEILVNGNYDVHRQRKHIEETQAYLADYTRTGTPTFLRPHLVTFPDGTREPLMVVTQGWVSIGSRDWFCFISHSSHDEHGEFACIGDLSIGIDKSGRYYFSRQHVCGGLSLSLPKSGNHGSISEFFTRNPGWFPFPRRWRDFAPQPPPVDIRSHVLGKWQLDSVDPKSKSLRGHVEFLDGDRGYGSLRFTSRGDDSYGGSCSLHCAVASSGSMKFSGFITGMTYLVGMDFEGTLEEAVEDHTAMDHLRLERQTNSVEVIYSHTNYYKVRMKKVVAPVLPAK